MADSIGLLVRSAYKVKNDEYPLFSDLFRDKPKDYRTAEQIKDYILERLTQGVNDEPSGISIADNS